MRFINTKTHGMLDYLTGVLLLAAPWLFGFAENTTALWVTVIAGAAIILMSLLTKYELGAVKAIPVPAHLGVDIVMGIALAASPWIFGFADIIFWPHLIIGLMEVGAGLCTHKMPYSTRAYSTA